MDWFSSSSLPAYSILIFTFCSIIIPFLGWITLYIKGYFIPSYEKALIRSDDYKELRVKKSTLLFWIGYPIVWLILAAMGDFHLVPVIFTLLALVISLIVVLTYLFCAKFYWNNEKITLLTLWLLRKTTLSWSEIASVTRIPFLNVFYVVKDNRGRLFFMPSRREFNGLPCFFAQLQQHKETITLKNMTWEQLDKLIAKSNHLYPPA